MEASMKKKTGKIEILVAEDSPTQAEQLQYLLKGHGYKVTIAANGRKALESIRRRAPALVLSDIVMPEMNGYELCQAIKSDDQLKHIPVMLVTTLSDPNDVIRGLECGADNFIRKPYEEKYLLSRVGYLLMNQEMRKNQKLQMGMEIHLGGQKHFISAERQQILDLLVSTFEQAVQVNSELNERKKELAHSNQVLLGLNRIAEGLNRIVIEVEVCDTALEHALELPGVRAGWISLLEGGSGFRLAAARNLPPALQEAGAMEGLCQCRRRLLAGELDHVTNILECERLGKAKGGTRGLLYHASVPLWSGDQILGVMNLVGADQGLFREEELETLYNVGHQVGVALERARLLENLEALVAERTAQLTAEIEERKRIEQEQSRLVAIIEATHDLVGTATPDGRLLYTNKAGLRMLGVTADDLSGLRIVDAHPEWAGKLLQEEAIPHALSHGSWSGETTILGANGREIPVHQMVLAHKGPDGMVEFLSTIARDITQLKANEARIARLNRIYAVLSGINATIVHVDNEDDLFQEACRIAVEDGQFIFAWIGRFDADSQQVTPVAQAGLDNGYLGQLNLVADDDIPGSCALTTQALTGVAPAVCNDIASDERMASWHDAALGRGYRSVAVFPLLLDERPCGVFALYSPDLNAFDAEELKLLIEMSGDISYSLDNLRREARRKQAEGELRKLSLAVEQSPNSIVITDLDANIEYVNEGFVRVSGYSREEVIGQNPRILQSGTTPPEVYRDLWARLTRGESWKGELINRRKDGREYVETLYVSPVRGANGDTTHYLAIKEDITDRKRAEEALLQLNESLEHRVAERTADLDQARREADAANRAKSAFLATMSHEIRTPMNGVLGMVEILAESRVTEHQTDLINIIRESATTLLGIIDNILDFSKIEAGRLDIEYTPVSVPDIVEGLCHSLVPLAAAKEVDLSLFIAPDTPERLLSDDLRLRQLLYNLVGNAIKFSPGNLERRGRVAIRVETLANDPFRLSFRIIDNGIGIKPETLEQLFTPFTQAEVDTTRRFGGTGLGLVICKRLVEMMQGVIHVESKPDAGSTFTVILPFEVPAEQPKRKQPDLSGLHCIVLESPDFNTDDIRAYLEHAGARVHVIANEAVAAEKAAHLAAPLVVIQASTHGAGYGGKFRSVPDVRRVLITHGRRRHARAQESDAVTLAGDALRRHALLRAVSVAAGRDSPEITHERADVVQLESERPLTIAEARAQNRLILVAEDDEVNQKVILQQLALSGYAAEVAGNGVEALHMWREGTYSLLLTDLHMPEMDGYTLAETIRREETGHRRIPILALTANAFRGEANRAHAAGMDAYLTKPVKLSALRAALKKWLPHDNGMSASNTSVAMTPSSPMTSAVDVSALKELFGDNSGVMHDLLTTYLETTLQSMKEMRAAVAIGDARQVGAIAHKLKSSFRTFGAMTLGDLCAELEKNGRIGNMSAITRDMPIFEAEVTKVSQEVARMLPNEDDSQENDR
jgi:PAS domain S-box-containing protein